MLSDELIAPLRILFISVPFTTLIIIHPSVPSYLTKMPADRDKAFYDLLDSAAVTTSADEDAIAQNKRIKEAEFAEDSREPTEEEEREIRRFVEESRHHEAKKYASEKGIDPRHHSLQGNQYHTLNPFREVFSFSLSPNTTFQMLMSFLIPTQASLHQSRTPKHYPLLSTSLSAVLSLPNLHV